MKFYNFSLPVFSVFLSLFLYTDAALSQQTITYTYDTLGRLTFVQDPIAGNRDYDYDAAGNRVAVNVGNSTDDAPPPPVLPAPTGLICRAVSVVWVAQWNAVPGAHHYRVARMNNQEFTVTENGDADPSGCKWVKACDANNVCSAPAFF